MQTRKMTVKVDQWLRQLPDCPVDPADLRYRLRQADQRHLVHLPGQWLQ
jgi:hypothetical protein